MKEQTTPHWKSIYERSLTPGFREALEREFPEGASEWADPVSRRRFLTLMGASLGLAGLTGCAAQPLETIVPYVRQPQGIIPGKPSYFATTLAERGEGMGVLVKSQMGRPIKVEGNPIHPGSLGATDAFAQAAVLTLYDPDRSQVILNAGRISTWDRFLTDVKSVLDSERTRGGAGIRILTEPLTSPTLASQLDAFLRAFPEARWHVHSAWSRTRNAHAGARLAFGEAVDPVFRVENATVLVALDSDFLHGGPGHLAYAREFARRRSPGDTMNRLYAFEPTPTLTGATADHRFPLRAREIETLAWALAGKLGVPVGNAPTAPLDARVLDAVVQDLLAHSGRSLVIAGEAQPPSVHALAHKMNEMLSNAGKTVSYIDPVLATSRAEDLEPLVSDLEASRVDLLLVLGSNPVYSAPADLGFGAALDKAKLRVHLGLYADETAELCHWHVPEAHALESWSDALAYDGTASLVQPLIAPLYAGKTAHELIALLLGQPQRSAQDVVRTHWQARTPSDFDAVWMRSLEAGIVAGTTPTPRTPRMTTSALPAQPTGSAETGIEVVFRPDPTIDDGRFANNGWLQELPKPVTLLTWDNAALVAPETAARLGLENEAVVDLELDGRSVRAPICILPGQAEDSVTVHLGYGRARAGRVGSGTGFNAYAIRPSTTPWFASGLKVRATGGRYALAVTQEHSRLEGRDVVREATLGTTLEPERAEGPSLSLYPDWTYEGYSWGMAVDLNACTGCSACVVACQSENNIPVVGKEQVLRGREMHWIRIDRYYQGSADRPETVHQPMLCQHCENAPCEVVCPVAATTHSPEGLNEMTYNRCVGTRYCSNNCPYKVRRFNFLEYTDDTTPVLKLLRNPEVTVRSRGVMEKCTYCVQRINLARIDAKNEDRLIRDGEIQTACEASCPAGAIVFGNVNDPFSRVSHLKRDSRHYAALGELGTRPRTTYLAKIRNPNPTIESPSPGFQGPEAPRG